jgi:hypothetical protein
MKLFNNTTLNSVISEYTSCQFPVYTVISPRISRFKTAIHKTYNPNICKSNKDIFIPLSEYDIMI